MGLHQADDFNSRLEFQFGGSLRSDLGPEDRADVHRNEKGLMGWDDPADLSPQLVAHAESGDLLPGEDDVGRRELDKGGKRQIAIAG